jgi:glycine/D-amino acid oxidase-like deaminating enzyme
VNPNKPLDAIVVGSGLIGASTTYYLSKYGVSTSLVEQGQLASGATGANFENFQVQDADFGYRLEVTIQGAQTYCPFIHGRIGRVVFRVALMVAYLTSGHLVVRFGS